MTNKNLCYDDKNWVYNKVFFVGRRYYLKMLFDAVILAAAFVLSGEFPLQL